MVKPLPNRFRIQVIQLDLELGIKGDKNGCPIKLAINRLYPSASRVEVTETRIAFSDPVLRERLSWEPLSTVSIWLHEFDAGKDVGPCDFILNKRDAVITPMPTRSVEERVAARAKAAELKKRQESETKEQRAERNSRNKRNRELARRGLA